MAIRPQFINEIKHDRGQVSAANTNRDGTGTVVQITPAAGANGGKVLAVRTKAVGTTTAGMIRLYIAESGTLRLFDEIDVAALTPSATVQTAETDVTYDNWLLESGQSVYASTHNAETFNVHIFWGNY